MKTTSFSIANYCVPCHAHCRYCLLASCGKATGVDYKAGETFAAGVIRDMKEARPDLPCSYYIGYCMDAPDLPEYLRFSREHQAPAAKFLQMNGFAFRKDQELEALMRSIRDAGVEMIDLTFYGTEEYVAKKAPVKKITSIKKATKKAVAKKVAAAKKPAAKKIAAAKKPAAKKAAKKPAKKVVKKLGKVIFEFDGKQIAYKDIEKKAAKLGGDVYVVAAEKKIYDADGKAVALF